MTIIESLQRYAPLSSLCQNALLAHTKLVTFQPHVGLLSAGQVADKIYFIEAGLARVYYYADDDDDDDDDKSITAWFVQEGGLLSSIDSFVSQTPSHEYIETLDKCHFRVLHYATMEKLFVDFPELNVVFRKLYQSYTQAHERRIRLLHTKNYTDRYLLFLKIYPKLSIRAKSKHIASFLNMSPEKLSRIKKELATKKDIIR